MKRVNALIILYLLILIFEGCSKDTEPYKEFPVPDWNIHSPELFPNSFTAIVALPDEINIYAGENDKVAAFIGDECRGIGTLVKLESSEKRVYYITIRALDTEGGAIVFKYYNALLSFMYQATQTVPFIADGTYGTYDSPVVLELEYIYED